MYTDVCIYKQTHTVLLFLYAGVSVLTNVSVQQYVVPTRPLKPTDVRHRTVLGDSKYLSQRCDKTE